MYDLYIKSSTASSKHTAQTLTTKVPVNLLMIQTVAMANSTALQLVFIGFAIVLCIALLLVKKVKKNSTKLCKPVMETGREKGEMVPGKYITKLCKPVTETGREKGELVLGKYDTAKPVMEEGREKGELVLRKYDISNYLFKAAWNGP